jgi:diguanylate cyclase (GGDEF)-like protein
MAALPDESADAATGTITEVPTAVALFDRDRRYVAASAAWRTAFGLPGSVLAGRRHDEVSSDEDSVLEEAQRRALGGESFDDFDASDVDPSGGWWGRVVSARPERDGDGAITGVLVALRDMQPPGNDDVPIFVRDPLTGLPGRHAFTRRLREVVAAGARRDAVVVFAVNIDGFRSINNLHGARIGDQVLRIIAERLVTGTRSRRATEAGTGDPRRGDMVARLGADEFGIVCGMPTPGSAETRSLSDRLLRIAQTPIAIADTSIRMTASVGYVVIGAEHRNEDDVLRDLDIALQEAKTRGPNAAVAWEPLLTRTASRRLSLVDQLRRALDLGEFVLHYQPVLRLSDGEMVGAEALLRWNHPSDGLVPPGAFLPVLEETGLIVPVGSWVIRESARQLESWHMLYGRNILGWLSFNASGRQFNDPSPLLQTLQDIGATGFPLERLKIEITETTIMRSPDMTRAVLLKLRELGLRIAIDDFGTGYSSLSILKQYPVDAIKIDGGFIAQIETEDGEKLVRALLSIAQIYGATVIAEGIETEPQRAILAASGCDYGQGYLFARPMDGAALGIFALTHGMTRVPAEESRLAG